MGWTRPCGCRGGDGGCSYSGSWSNICKDYPNCVSGIEDAKRVVANREYNLPENVAARKLEREKKEVIRRYHDVKRDAKRLKMLKELEEQEDEC